jgi:hypothetical protein
MLILLKKFKNNGLNANNIIKAKQLLPTNNNDTFDLLKLSNHYILN